MQETHNNKNKRFDVQIGTETRETVREQQSKQTNKMNKRIIQNNKTNMKPAMVVRGQLTEGRRKLEMMEQGGLLEFSLLLVSESV